MEGLIYLFVHLKVNGFIYCIRIISLIETTSSGNILCIDR